MTQLKRFTARVVRPFALDGGRLILPSDLLATVTANRLVKIGPTGLFTLVAEAPGSPGEPIVDVVDGRLPAAAVAMRLGWSQSRTFIEGTFVRANNHPIDGAADGTTLGLNVPPFPPALASDASLYPRYMARWRSRPTGDRPDCNSWGKLTCFLPCRRPCRRSQLIVWLGITIRLIHGSSRPAMMC